MDKLTLHQLRCLDAVVTSGGFQAGAEKLSRSQPAVFAAIKALEAQLDLTLLDRSGYRVVLTDVGRSFHAHARLLLQELDKLEVHVTQLAMGEESELTVVIGDLCPTGATLALLRRFFDASPRTRLHLHFESIAGPWERLFDREADLIIHHIDKADPRLEFIDLLSVRLIPVVAPNFLSSRPSTSLTPDDMRGYVQCIIRDSARHSAPRDYFVVEGARSWTVSDQLMKREVILQGMGWGHLPDFLISEDLQSGRLLSIIGEHWSGGSAELVAARLRKVPHGPVAERLWQFIAGQAQLMNADARPATAASHCQ